MIKDSEYKKALSIIKSLIKIYPYVETSCQKNKGKPCKTCSTVNKAKEYIASTPYPIMLKDNKE
jgi:hypothetical protein